MTASKSLVRLNKHLATLGIASRRAADRLIAEGAVEVNGMITTELGKKIDPQRDQVRVKQATLDRKKSELVYILLHKPAGYVTTTHRTALEPRIVIDLLKGVRARVFPIGRLDKESTGLLLLTNDGDLAYRLMHPSFEHEKEYLVELNRPLTADDLKKLRSGLPVLGQKTLPPKVEKLSPYRFLITLKEGKNRQIRRLIRQLGSGVNRLKRIRIGALSLPPDLPPGAFIFLNSTEIARLFPMNEAGRPHQALQKETW